MSITGGHLDAMLAAGCSAEQIVALVKADLAERECQLAAKREKDAIRQRRHRESRDVTVTDCDDAESPSPLDAPLTKVSQTLQKNTPPLTPQPNYLRGKDLPGLIPAEPWAAFVRMRKATPKVPFTEDAARGAARKVIKLAGEGYDPAKLLWMAVDKGWRTVFANDECKAMLSGISAGPIDWEAKAKDFERIGQHDAAEECRRKRSTPVGSLVENIVARAAA